MEVNRQPADRAGGEATAMRRAAAARSSADAASVSIASASAPFVERHQQAGLPLGA